MDGQVHKEILPPILPETKRNEQNERHEKWMKSIYFYKRYMPKLNLLKDVEGSTVSTCV